MTNFADWKSFWMQTLTSSKHQTCRADVTSCSKEIRKSFPLTLSANLALPGPCLAPKYKAPTLTTLHILDSFRSSPAQATVLQLVSEAWSTVKFRPQNFSPMGERLCAVLGTFRRLQWWVARISRIVTSQVHSMYAIFTYIWLIFMVNVGK